MLSLFANRALWLVAGLLLSVDLLAGENRAFEHDSRAQIEAEYQGEKFVLSVWSLDCPPCFKELKMFARLRAEGEDFNLVLLAADDPERSVEAQKLLAEFGLAGEDSWIYAHDQSAKLRYSLDNQWYGELPRTYFYNAEGERRGISGLLDEAIVRDWLY